MALKKIGFAVGLALSVAGALTLFRCVVFDGEGTSSNALPREMTSGEKDEPFSEDMALQKVSVDVASSYEKGDVKVVTQGISQMREILARREWRGFERAIEPVVRLHYRNFLGSKELPKLSSDREVRRYCELNVQTGRALGETYVLRGWYDGYASGVESLTYRQLKRLEGDCHAEGEFALADIVAGYLQSLVSVIESEDCLLRQCIRGEIEKGCRFAQDGLVERSSYIRERRRLAYGLIRSGHIPGWLSEFDVPGSPFLKDPVVRAEIERQCLAPDTQEKPGK